MRSNIVLIGSVVVALVAIVLAVSVFKPKEVVTLPILMEEYADYNCPHCAEFRPVVRKLVSDFGAQLNFQMIPHPILGTGSVQAVYAAEAARNQAKFDEYSDKLFDTLGSRQDSDYIKYAQEIGLDINKFNSDREDKTLQKMVDDRLEANSNKGILQTPTVYIGGKRVVDISYDNLYKLISDKIKIALESAPVSK